MLTTFLILVIYLYELIEEGNYYKNIRYWNDKINKYKN